MANSGNLNVQSCPAAERSEDLFRPLTPDQVLYDLAESRRQIADGRSRDMREALAELGAKHGFV